MSKIEELVDNLLEAKFDEAVSIYVDDELTDATHAARAALLAEYKRLEEENAALKARLGEWISVEDRLPEDGRRNGEYQHRGRIEDNYLPQWKMALEKRDWELYGRKLCKLLDAPKIVPAITRRPLTPPNQRGYSSPLLPPRLPIQSTNCFIRL